MKNLPLIIILTLVLSSAIFSCTKNTGPEYPVITLTTPTDTTVINAGDTIQIKGSVSDNKDLHEFYLTLQNDNTGTVLFYDNPYVHGAKIHNFNYQWNNVDSAIYKLTIQALDHENHTSTKEVLLHVN
jgi:hypothetical protein